MEHLVFYPATLVTGNFSLLVFGSLMGWKNKWSRCHMLLCRQSGSSEVLVQAIENNSCWKVSSFSWTHICCIPLLETRVSGAKATLCGGSVCVWGGIYITRPEACEAGVCWSPGATRNSAGRLPSGSEVTSTWDRSGLGSESETLSLSWEEKHPWSYTLWRGAGSWRTSPGGLSWRTEWPAENEESKRWEGDSKRKTLSSWGAGDGRGRWGQVQGSLGGTWANASCCI